VNATSGVHNPHQHPFGERENLGGDPGRKRWEHESKIGGKTKTQEKYSDEKTGERLEDVEAVLASREGNAKKKTPAFKRVVMRLEGTT